MPGFISISAMVTEIFGLKVRNIRLYRFSNASVLKVRIGLMGSASISTK